MPNPQQFENVHLPALFKQDLSEVRRVAQFSRPVEDVTQCPLKALTSHPESWKAPVDEVDTCVAVEGGGFVCGFCRRAESWHRKRAIAVYLQPPGLEQLVDTYIDNTFHPHHLVRDAEGRILWDALEAPRTYRYGSRFELRSATGAFLPIAMAPTMIWSRVHQGIVCCLTDSKTLFYSGGEEDGPFWVHAMQAMGFLWEELHADSQPLEHDTFALRCEGGGTAMFKVESRTAFQNGGRIKFSPHRVLRVPKDLLVDPGDGPGARVWVILRVAMFRMRSLGPMLERSHGSYHIGCVDMGDKSPYALVMHRDCALMLHAHHRVLSFHWDLP